MSKKIDDTTETIHGLIEKCEKLARAQGFNGDDWEPLVPDLEWICDRLGHKPTPEEWEAAGLKLFRNDAYMTLLPAEDDEERDMRAQHLIDRSISHTEIVHAEWSAELADALKAASEESVEASATVVEYWGTTEDGDEWRVHLTGERAAITRETDPLTVNLIPAEDEAECERLGLSRIYEVRRGAVVIWAGEAESDQDARERATSR